MATNQTTSTYYSLIAATVGAGIALAVAGHLHQQGAPVEPTPQVVAQLQEDDPGWDCAIHGDRICGDPAGVHATAAWDAWDAGQGWRRLPAASTEVRVEYVGTATQPPEIDRLTEVAIPSVDGNWYVFRATPADALPAPRNGQILPF